MKTIKIGEKEITLDIGEELRVKDLKKIQPILLKQVEGNEVEMICNVVNALSIEDVTDILDNLTVAEFTILSEQITEILSFEKKTKA